MKQNCFRRLTQNDRCQIGALFKIGKSISYIGQEVGFHKSTISREVSRNLVWGRQYFANKAHDESLKRRANCHRKPVITGELLEIIKEKLKDQWSPEQIAGRLKRDKQFSVSTQTIYTFIYTKSKDLNVYLRGKRSRG